MVVRNSVGVVQRMEHVLTLNNEDHPVLKPFSVYGSQVSMFWPPPPPQSTSLIGKKMSCHTGLLSVVRKHSMCSAQAYSLKKILGLRGIDEVPISPAWHGLLA